MKGFHSLQVTVRGSRVNMINMQTEDGNDLFSVLLES